MIIKTSDALSDVTIFNLFIDDYQCSISTMRFVFENNHNRHFSLMDMYAAFDADNSENSDDSSDEQEDIVVKVTFKKHSHKIISTEL